MKKSPLRAILALGGRCARRAEQRARLPDDHPEEEKCRAALANAIGHSDGFMKRAIDDYGKLLRRDIGSDPQAGSPIDPSAKGPLGPLEPAGSLR